MANHGPLPGVLFGVITPRGIQAGRGRTEYSTLVVHTFILLSQTINHREVPQSGCYMRSLKQEYRFGGG